MFNLLPLVAGADGDNGRTASEPGPNPARGVFKDDAVGRAEAQLPRCEEERVGRRLARLQALVVCGDRHLGGNDADARHASKRYRQTQSISHSLIL